MMSSTEKKLVNLLSKEFWGVLSFELNLPALYELISGDKMGIGLKRFGDWVLFPDKIPLEHQKKFLLTLNKRNANPDYDKLKFRPMKQEEKDIHLLIMELLRLKHLGGSVDPSCLHHIYQLPGSVFFAFSIQFVEKGYISSQNMMQIYQHYYYDEGAKDE